jgi:hypothetical protein
MRKLQFPDIKDFSECCVSARDCHHSDKFHTRPTDGESGQVYCIVFHHDFSDDGKEYNLPLSLSLRLDSKCAIAKTFAEMRKVVGDLTFYAEIVIRGDESWVIANYGGIIGYRMVACVKTQSIIDVYERCKNMDLYIVTYKPYCKSPLTQRFEGYEEAKEFIKSIISNSFSVDLYVFKNNTSTRIFSK